MEKNTEQKFMSLAPMIRTANGEIAYLRIGKGIAYGKVWCDYVTTTDELVYLPNKFFPTIEEAVNALYEKCGLND